MDPTPHQDLEPLLSNASWARALARSLVHDTERADDLVQRAWVAALERPPRDPSAARGWIASVMRNFVRQDRRTDARRTDRERASAKHEASEPNPVDEQAALQRELLEAVLALRDPQRSTIWARYYDGLAPRDIARRDGVPVKTVKTRLARGLAELRERLDRSRGGDRAAWMLAFAPMAKSAPLPLATFGAVIMQAKLMLALAVIATAGLVVLLVAFTRERPLDPDPNVHAAAAATQLEPARRDASELAPADVARKSERTIFETPAVESAKTAPIPRTLHGRVIDLSLAPVAGLEVFARSGARDNGTDKPAVARSATDGTFEMPFSEGRIELGARGRDMVTVFAASNAWGVSADYSIFVAPRRALAGRVVDHEHRPVAGASVRFLLDDALRRDIGAVLDTAQPSEWITTSDDQGNFALENAPQWKGTLRGEFIGLRTTTIAAPDAPTWTLEIVLEPLDVKPLIVHGIVVDERAHPISGAQVAFGPQTFATGDDGKFTFDTSDVREGGEAVQNAEGVWVPRFRPDSLFAVKPGKLPTRITLPSTDEMRRDPSQGFTIVLSGEPLEIRGRVLELDGSPVANAIIRLRDETPFGMIYRKIGDEGIAITTSAEALLRGGASNVDARTNQRGEFTVGGLLDREYRVIAFDPRTLRRTTTEPIHAGKLDAELRMPDRAHCTRVAGRVLGLDGTPIAGASVGVGTTLENEHEPFYPTEVETDVLGAFAFESVATEAIEFSIVHPSTFIVMGWKPGANDALDALEVRVARKAHVQVDLGTDKDKANGFKVLDARGTPVELVVSRGNVMWMPDHGDIVDGRSEPIACSESGRTLVLYKGEVEVARLPMSLVPGQITVVRP